MFSFYTEVDWRVQAVRYRPGWLDSGFLWTVSIHGLQYSITHMDHHRRAQMDETVPKQPAPPVCLPSWTLQDFLNLIFSPNWVVSIHKTNSLEEPFWSCNILHMTVLVGKYSYCTIPFKKNLVVFCLLSNLNIVAESGLENITDTSVSQLVCYCLQTFKCLNVNGYSKLITQLRLRKKCIVNKI